VAVKVVTNAATDSKNCPKSRPITAKESRNRNSEASCTCYYLKMVVRNNSRIELNDQKFENLALLSEKNICAMSDERG
jgi:hypothetical protein